MAKIIALTNQKGGVGKTTTCCAICGGLAQMGKKVLAIDLDPQGNLSFSLGIDDEDAYTIYDVFKALGASISSGNRWKLSATSTTT